MKSHSKPIIGVLFLLLFAGCVTRTEFGRRRLAKSGPMATDTKVYSIIDTTKLYEIISAAEILNSKPLTSVNKTYLKFYANGRVGTFYKFQPNDPGTLNPKKAEIGYYAYNGKEIVMRNFFEHPQGGGWIKDQIISFKGDTLHISSQNILSKYQPLAIPQGLSNYKPDW